MTRVLVVGAGFAGAVYARELAERGFEVEIIDRRPHLAGNAFDAVGADGIRVHRYGPHIFHTSNEQVVEWLSRFGRFVPYRHRVQALLPDRVRCAPLPINRRTINQVFGTGFRTEAEVKAHLARIALPVAQPRNAAEHLYGTIGVELTDLFFRPYTRKMWALDLEDMDAAVVRRLPLRFDEEEAYFADDRFQLMPEAGYTALFERILDHPRIAVSLGVAFARGMERDCAYCFNSMPIDEYFDCSLGPLPYRSIRFHHRDEARDYDLAGTTVVNFTDESPFTRQTDWSRFPCHVVRPGGTKTVTLEEPCDYRDNGLERYYPVRTSDGRFQALYQRYKSMAEAVPNLRFIGRCGTYQYLDMHQVINQSLAGAREWLSRAGAAA